MLPVRLRHCTATIPAVFPLPLKSGKTSEVDKQAVASLLKKCSRFEELKLIHGAMIKTDTHQDSFLINQFIAACSTFLRINYSLLVFDQLEAPNVFVYNALLRGFVRCSLPDQALCFYVQQMAAARVSASSFTYSSLIKACTLASAVEFGEAVHGRIRKTGFGPQLFVQTGLLDFYANCGRIEDAGKVFDEMAERDVVAWTTMIYAYAQIGDLVSAERVFDEMPGRNLVAWNTLIAGYARRGEVDAAASLFNAMQSKDLVTWTTMISCYSQNQDFRAAVETFKGMKIAGVFPDEVTIATVISACAHLGSLDIGKGVHLYAAQNGFDLDVYMGSALIDMYAKCGSIERSLVVFFKLREKNLFCWNAIIEGLAVHGFSRESLSMFSRMEKMKIIPNKVTFVSVLGACTHAGLVEDGKRIFSRMTQDYSISPEIEHYGCMVDLLSRAGLLDEAMSLVTDMKTEPNAVIWGALLGGCKIHGNMEIGRIVLKQLMILEPCDSGHYSLLVNMYAEAKQWGEVANIRGEMKQRSAEKKSPGHSCIELDEEVHEFVACDISHPFFDEISLMLVDLDGQLKLAGCELDLGMDS